MAGELYIQINSKHENLEEDILNFCFKNIETLVNKLNFFDSKSLLSKLNNTKKIDYDKDISFLIQESIKLYQKSLGKFNIFLGEEILKRKQNLDNKTNKKIYINKIIKIDNQSISILDNNIKIDLGAIAKGYIIDQALKNTKQNFSKINFDIIIDARGDIIISGREKIEIEVENPFNSQISFEKITLNKGSIITSGHNRQKFKFGSHIVGNQNDIFTITLVSKKEPIYKLDALGTWFSLEKSHKVLELLEFDLDFENIQALLILKNGKILKSSFWNMFSKN